MRLGQRRRDARSRSAVDEPIARSTELCRVGQLAAAAGPDGKRALKLSSLSYGQYQRMDWGGTPKGCSPKCECRRTALDGNRPIQICVDPEHSRELHKAALAARKADVQQQGSELESL